MFRFLTNAVNNALLRKTADTEKQRFFKFRRVQDVLNYEHQLVFRPTIEENDSQQMFLCSQKEKRVEMVFTYRHEHNSINVATDIVNSSEVKFFYSNSYLHRYIERLLKKRFYVWHFSSLCAIICYYGLCTNIVFLLT